MTDYTIKAGDTLSAIARANGTTVKNLMELNPQIKDANSIFANDKIKLSADENQPRDLSILAQDVTYDGGINLKGFSVEKQSTTQNEASKENHDNAASKFLYGAGGAAAYKAAEVAAPYVKEGAIKAGQFVKENAEKVYDKTKDAAKSAKDAAVQAKNSVTDKVKSAVTTGKEKVASAKTSVKEAVNSAIERGKNKYQNLKGRFVKSANGMAENAKQKVIAGKEVIMEKSAQAKNSTISGSKKFMKSAKAVVGKGAKVLSKAAPAAKLAGKVAKPIAVAYSAVEIADAYDKGGTKAAAKKGANLAASVGGAWAGVTAGASIGAAVGSVVPIVGTAAGAVVGGFLGSIGGWIAGDKISQKVLEQ